jgi:hypothetical protein
MSFLATSRFNTDTWNQNHSYRTKHQVGGCIYGTPLEISQKIPLDSSVFIVEMNNSTNQIMGIGLIKNVVQFDKYYSIYQTGNYNRYIYKSKFRVSRETIEKYNKDILLALDHICFKEKTHLKRGSGITLIPDKLLQHTVFRNIDLQKDLELLFKKEFGKKNDVG